ncbi:hypothetical protein Tco_0752386 [Tanacetum coccineum]|uniref:Uncharacterized protein n=1 Tax=Tanacetum coccineum TaxID=301880 RepID=A0ABQ4Z6V2_9ASTR
MNGDAPAIASASTEGHIPPKTVEQKLARKNELKAKSTLLLAIPDEHLLKFHGIKDAKTLWEAIKASYNKVWTSPFKCCKQSSPRVAASISTARHVNTAALKQKVNAASPTKYSYFKAHSPLRRPFDQKSAAKANNFNKKVYTAKVNNVTTAGPEVVVSTAEGKRENAVKSSACWIWRPTGKGKSTNMLYRIRDFDSGCTKANDWNNPTLQIIKTLMVDLLHLQEVLKEADEVLVFDTPINSKAFRVFNTRTRKVEENLHINFLENKPNVAGSGPEWLFDIDSLTKSMKITVENQTNGDASIKSKVNAGQAGQEKASDHEYILLPLMLSNSPLSLSS